MNIYILRSSSILFYAFFSVISWQVEYRLEWLSNSCKPLFIISFLFDFLSNLLTRLPLVIGSNIFIVFCLKFIELYLLTLSFLWCLRLWRDLSFFIDFVDNYFSLWSEANALNFYFI